MPDLNLQENSSYALKLGGIVKGFNFSASYLYGRDGLPVNYYNRISPVDESGGLYVKSLLFFPRMHYAGSTWRVRSEALACGPKRQHSSRQTR
jgi:hypothetical protein